MKAYPNQVCLSTGWKEEGEDPAKAELWEADWDDTSVSDNFAQQLRTAAKSCQKVNDRPRCCVQLMLRMTYKNVLLTLSKRLSDLVDKTVKLVSGPCSVTFIL